jgi:4-alpha-glucanotransferase
MALESPARLAVLPAQDVLGLGNDSRMNRPGGTEGNWAWRLERGQLDAPLAARMREETEDAGRR